MCTWVRSRMIGARHSRPSAPSTARHTRLGQHATTWWLNAFHSFAKNEVKQIRQGWWLAGLHEMHATKPFYSRNAHTFVGTVRERRKTLSAYDFSFTMCIRARRAGQAEQAGPGKGGPRWPGVVRVCVCCLVACAAQEDQVGWQGMFDSSRLPRLRE